VPETIDSAADRPTGPAAGGTVAVLVAARDEAERIGATVAALARAFPGASLWVADDGSTDATAAQAEQAGARVLSSGGPLGKGGALTLAAERLLRDQPRATVFLLCDGDLGDSAGRLGPLLAAVEAGGADLAVAVFSQRVGGGVGLAVGVGRALIGRLCGFRARAPLSGQRVLSRQALQLALPFAAGFGMEVGMTIDAVRGGGRVVEIELELAHRATGRSTAGFLHRGRQLVDIVRAGAARR
jgi:glycosyltransferase involved in cell wall biosynthesis